MALAVPLRPDPGQALKVSTNPGEPFVIMHQDGKLDGISRDPSRLIVVDRGLWCSAVAMTSVDDGELAGLPDTVAARDYAYALPENSPRLEESNRVLLRVLQHPQ